LTFSPLQYDLWKENKLLDSISKTVGASQFTNSLGISLLMCTKLLQLYKNLKKAPRENQPEVATEYRATIATKEDKLAN
ncbi:6995_t:CDS:2, partial [Gigaspora margarita]